MTKIEKPETEAQKQRRVKTKLLSSFRRYVTFKGTGSAVSKWLGMNVWEMREYLESQWLDGMTWDNYGELWCVDHIVALKYFDGFKEDEMRLCWNYNNLKPSYMTDNHAKGYCIEVTIRILLARPYSVTVELLKNWVRSKEEMFHPYYQ